MMTTKKRKNSNKLCKLNSVHSVRPRTNQNSFQQQNQQTFSLQQQQQHYQPIHQYSNNKIHQTVTGETTIQPYPRKISLEVKIPLTNMVFKLDVQYAKV